MMWIVKSTKRCSGSPTIYDRILEELTNNQISWNRGSSNEVIFFPRPNLTHTSKTCFYIVYAKLRPSKHVSTVLRDKAILTFSIVNGFKFNVRHVIKSSIFEFENGKALPHPFLITKSFLMVGVEMSESKEKCPPLATLPLPNEKQSFLPSKSIVG